MEKSLENGIFDTNSELGQNHQMKYVLLWAISCDGIRFYIVMLFYCGRQNMSLIDSYVGSRKSFDMT